VVQWFSISLTRARFVHGAPQVPHSARGSQSTARVQVPQLVMLSLDGALTRRCTHSAVLSHLDAWNLQKMGFGNLGIWEFV
jgi:hypothetical protein